MAWQSLCSTLSGQVRTETLRRKLDWVKHALRYFCSTKAFDLRCTCNRSTVIRGYSDSGCTQESTDHKSITGNVFCLCRAILEVQCTNHHRTACRRLDTLLCHLLFVKCPGGQISKNPSNFALNLCRHMKIFKAVSSLSKDHVLNERAA